MPDCLTPMPARFGEVPGELLLDFGGLFRVYRVGYKATPPLEPVAAHLAKAGVAALVLFTKDQKDFQLLYQDQERRLAQADAQGVENLLGRLCELQRQGKDPLEAAQWVKGILQAQAEQEGLFKKRPYRNQGLFSEHYLEVRLRETPEWSEDPEPVRQELLELYRFKRAILENANESQTEEEFIQPVLKALGFAYWVQDAQKASGSLQRPDYVLYPDEDTKAKAVVQKEEAKRLAPALALAEAKYFGRDLDVKKRDARDLAPNPVTPSFQLSGYLQSTGLEWGILTNGREWRLYWGRAVDRQNRYFAVDLVQALEDPEAFRFFWLFFRREAFLEGPQGSFLRRVLEASEQYGLRVGERLKEVVFEEVFPLLAEGFLRYHTEVRQEAVDETVLKETYRATMVLLYRLLFLLYAEDRNLLPVHDVLGYRDLSLTQLRREVAEGMDRGRVYIEDSHVLWEHLSALFTLIDKGDRRLKVPPYNGGLFRPGLHPFLDTHKVADAFLAPALDRLSRQPDEGERLRFVDYKYLTVRELGAVYEGLLEYRLAVAQEDLAVVKEGGLEVYKPKAQLSPKEKPLHEVPKGKPYLVYDQHQRKVSGSYYTPDYVVEYIVRRTLEPVVEGRKEALRKVLEEYQHHARRQEKHPTHEGAKRLAELRHRALEALLDVKVVDPAMGSGHFLVGAVNFLAERFAGLIAELRAEPVLDALAELRQEIRQQIGEYGLEVKDEQLSDSNLLKRMVMKRCVFGVDLNDMAVELAKLSLWLDAFTVGAPLSFLDHHLRTGNSVLGVSRDEFMAWVERESPVWLTEIEAEVEAATRKAQALLDVRDLTPAEVALSQELYAQAEAALLPLRRALDVYAASFFAPKPKRGQPLPPLWEARVYLPSFKLADLATPPAKHHVPEALALARERCFFHWEFEFPEVFFSPERRHNPGFDAVIGNPPYVRQEQIAPNKPFLEKAFESVYSGSADLYVYFFARGLSVLREGGRLGFISSRQFTRAAYGEGLRRLLAAQRIREVIDFGENPVFEGAATFPAIFIVEKPHRESAGSFSPVRFKPVSKEEFASLLHAPSEARKEALEELVKRGQDLDEEAFRPEGWTLGDANINAILQKMEAVGVPLREYAGEFYRGILTGFNEAFFIDEATRIRLIQEDPKSAELIKPLLVGDDVRHYYALWERRYLLFMPWNLNIERYPRVKQHLSSFYDMLAERPEVKQGRFPWYALSRYGAEYHHLLEGPKIVYPVIAREPRFYLDAKGFYINDKLFFIPKEDYYLLAVLNSRVAFGAMKLKLSSLGDPNEGGRLELRAVHLQHLPIPRIERTTEEEALSQALDEARKHYGQEEYEALEAWARAQLQAGGRDVVAAFLAYLAQEMQRTQGERLALEGEWREWVKHTFPQADRLGQEWLAEEWPRHGLEGGVEAIVERFRAKRVPTTPKTLAQLKEESQRALEELRPLYRRLETTDRLVDRLVAWLYGLTDEEAERLWMAPSG
ncbi:Eco57I restriction-modification methylase domain-containing protein [Thermus caliditerrae]|uniref:Eco57I restriction-modification methylase domain-containing protein n=1 Tax=Thermus caliditerrae TaxID=1330700 RepID=UPI001F1EC828|nr:TaqI-like C-terminal specificity domain-containing protein [Thermus caliditerrae]